MDTTDYVFGPLCVEVKNELEKKENTIWHRVILRGLEFTLCFVISNTLEFLP